MYYLLNNEQEIVGYSTSKVNPAMQWTDEDIVEVGNKMFFASQTEEIAHARVEYAKAQEKERQIEQLKHELASTDYKCLKYVDGALSEEEYTEVRAYRAGLRRKINELTER